VVVAGAVRHVNDNKGPALPIGDVLRRHVVVEAVVEHALAGLEIHGHGPVGHPGADILIQAAGLARSAGRRRELQFLHELAARRLIPGVAVAARYHVHTAVVDGGVVQGEPAGDHRWTVERPEVEVVMAGEVLILAGRLGDHLVVP
jgi:hypothetical protein